MQTDTVDTARKIRALLDKAEATEFADERDAFVAKAMSLMARHQITDAMLAAATTDPSRRGTPTEVVVNLGSGPYVRARLSLIGHIAESNRCKVLTRTSWEGREALLWGFPNDLERTELLYTSLLVQATNAMYAAPTPAGVATVRSRRSFLLGFAEVVGRRLAQSLDQAAHEYQQTTGTAGVAVVLADRQAEVEAAVAHRYGRVGVLGSSGRTGIDMRSTRAGRAAGERADLAGGRGIRPRARGALEK